MGPEAAVDTGAPTEGGDAAEAGEAGAPSPWQSLANTPTFAPDVPLLLTDGSVMVHSLDDASTWWRLAPDDTGSYVNGAWSEVAPMPSGYEPLFFASAVLMDGTVIVAGGEYNRDGLVEIDTAALYDPVADAWTPVNPPSAWTSIGDAASVVLSNGVFMLGSTATSSQALFDPRTLTWTMTGAGKANVNSEEGFTLLPSGKVFTVDVFDLSDAGAVKVAHNAELYDPTTGSWSSAGDPPVSLSDPTLEIGPAVLLPSGAVFAMGATSHTAFYQPDGTWKAGPDFPIIGKKQLHIVDGPAVLLPSGNVLCVASPGDYLPPAHFLEFDGASFTEVRGTKHASADASFNVYLLLLPTGQVLAIDGTPDIEVYTPSGAPDASWAPTIATAPSDATRGAASMIVGTQLNGLSQAVSYGDDYQAATNYPLVRITNDATSHVSYARTHDHSTMAVATGSQSVSTVFDVASDTETGMSHLVVVANGIASSPVAVNIH